MNADVDAFREAFEEEQESKSDLQRQLSRAKNEAQQWRSRFESEGTSKTDELEEAKLVFNKTNRHYMLLLLFIIIMNS